MLKRGESDRKKESKKGPIALAPKSLRTPWEKVGYSTSTQKRVLLLKGRGAIPGAVITRKKMRWCSVRAQEEGNPIQLGGREFGNARKSAFEKRSKKRGLQGDK